MPVWFMFPKLNRVLTLGFSGGVAYVLPRITFADCEESLRFKTRAARKLERGVS
jgi:hypothetical protein